MARVNCLESGASLFEPVHNREEHFCGDWEGCMDFLSFVIAGASGDLAKKKTLPALFDLYLHKFLPSEFVILGYARSNLMSEELRTRYRPFLEKVELSTEEDIEIFLQHVHYSQGRYDSIEDFGRMVSILEQFEGKAKANRVYYFALPPEVFLHTAVCVKNIGIAPTGFTRLIVEKPFGYDLDSARDLSINMAKHFDESFIFRIDHYLGKELVQNLLLMRFTNTLFEPLWNREHIACVTITFKEDFGTMGRGGYFDTSGIIRDVMQNHLMQIVTLVAMEPPVKATGDDFAKYVRNNKVDILKCIRPIDFNEVVLGQYGCGPGGQPGYTDDDTVPDGSQTATFATIVLRISNRRWEGVPFVLRAGKALSEKKAEIRIQFKDPPAADYMFEGLHCPRNELVMRLQPEEAVYLKCNVKAPGLDTMATQSELDLTYTHRYPMSYVPDAYSRLILEVLRNRQAAFVRNDELLESWACFTPLLNAIDSGVLGPPIKYVYGSRGPPQSDQLMKRVGFVYNYRYIWADQRSYSQPVIDNEELS
eukprot:535094_1